MPINEVLGLEEVYFHQEKEEKLSPKEVNTSGIELIDLFDDRFKNSVMNEGRKVTPLFTGSSIGYYDHNYTDELTRTSWGVTRLKDSVSIQRTTKGLDENNKLYHLELIFIRLGESPSCIYKKYNFNSDDFNGKKWGVIIEHHGNTPSAIDKSREVIKAIPQMKKSNKVSSR